MKNNLIHINIIMLLNLILLFKLSLSMIIFPFEIIKEKNANIKSDDINYNYKNFIKDYFYQNIYINLNIGSPPHEIKTLLTYEDNGFKIRNISECIDYNEKEEIDITAFSDINFERKIKFKNII